MEILVLQLGLHKTSQNILISPPAMLFTQLGLPRAFIKNLSGHYLVFNNTTKEFALEREENFFFTPQIYFMRNCQTPFKHKDILVNYNLGDGWHVFKRFLKLENHEHLGGGVCVGVFQSVSHWSFN